MSANDLAPERLSGTKLWLSVDFQGEESCAPGLDPQTGRGLKIGWGWEENGMSASDRGKSKAKAWVNLKCWEQGVEHSLQKIPFREFSRSQGGVQFQKPAGEIQAQFGGEGPGLDKVVGHYLPALCISRRATLLPLILSHYCGVTDTMPFDPCSLCHSKSPTMLKNRLKFNSSHTSKDSLSIYYVCALGTVS